MALCALRCRCREPVAGIVSGIDAGGALLVRTGADTRVIHAGSLVLEKDV